MAKLKEREEAKMMQREDLLNAPIVEKVTFHSPRSLIIRKLSMDTVQMVKRKEEDVPERM